jgi:hypothetical protein
MHGRSTQPTNQDLSCCNIDNSAPALKVSATGRPNAIAGSTSHLYSAPPPTYSRLLPATASDIYVKPVNQKTTDLRI